MGRRRQAKAGSQSSASAHAGVWEVETGTVELVPDDLAPGAWTVLVNGVPSSHIDPARPERLDFEYMRWMAEVLRMYVPAHLDPQRLRLLHLGGGACSMARWVAQEWPAARQVVVELDGRLVELVREWFDLPRAPLLRIRAGEARAVTESLTESSREVVIRDVFAGAVTPEPLTTLEFTRQVERVLTPEGIYLLNVGDHRDLRGTREELAALRSVFEHTAAVADPAMLKGRRRGNVVLAASHRPLPETGSPEAAAMTRSLLIDAVPAQYKDAAWTRRLTGTVAPRLDPPSSEEAGTRH
ncbi:spermidine synthase [Kocuria coralli]|uniref:Spermidine synthase n=1 Tax=Kocuria coralli TaxID=1461025 RepID=A0A5J5KWM8_9MICC|nr:fused MFS/spermidine synthase [Kocuria coralli]KAA9393872.1 spermidine synthase [Kocuria coralli]